MLEIGERMLAKLPNGDHVTPEKQRYANARLTLEFATAFLAAPGAAALVRCLPASVESDT